VVTDISEELLASNLIVVMMVMMIKDSIHQTLCSVSP
jgi:hypothetical protein